MSQIVAVSLNPHHGFSKQPQLAIHLLAGQGVQGDAHCGPTVQHIYLKRRTPTAPNRMQVHLIGAELFDDLAAIGFTLSPGELGENITTRNLDLKALPLGTQLHLGEQAVIELTGLRTPCSQIDSFRPGLLKQLIDANKAPRAGVMAIVLTGGTVSANEAVRVQLPPQPHVPLTMI